MARRVCVGGGHVVCVKVGVGSVARAGAVAALFPDQQRAASASRDGLRFCSLAIGWNTFSPFSLPFLLSRDVLLPLPFPP